MRLIKFVNDESEIWINTEMINAVYTDEAGTIIDTNGYKYWVSETLEEVLEKI